MKQEKYNYSDEEMSNEIMIRITAQDVDPVPFKPLKVQSKTQSAITSLKSDYIEMEDEKSSNVNSERIDLDD